MEIEVKRQRSVYGAYVAANNGRPRALILRDKNISLATIQGRRLAKKIALMILSAVDEADPTRGAA